MGSGFIVYVPYVEPGLQGKLKLKQKSLRDIVIAEILSCVSTAELI